MGQVVHAPPVLHAGHADDVPELQQRPSQSPLVQCVLLLDVVPSLVLAPQLPALK